MVAAAGVTRPRVCGGSRGVSRGFLHPDRVSVATGQQRCPGRRADGLGLEVVELQTALSESVNVGRRDPGSVTAQISETCVVQNDVDDIRAAVGGPLGDERGRL